MSKAIGKYLLKYIDTGFIKSSLILALVYCALFNSAVFIFKFDHYKASFLRGMLELVKDFCYIYAYSCIIFLALCIHKAVLRISVLFLFITSAIASYYLFFFKIQPTKNIIGSVFSTNINELYELLSLKLIIWICCSTFIAIYILRRSYINDNNSYNSKSYLYKLLPIICFLLFIVSIIRPPFKMLQNYFPLQYLHNTYLVFAPSFDNRNFSKRDISKEYDFIDNSDPDVIGVLVIGESARFDHFGLNGYKRDTTPYLKTIDNLFSFKAKSSSNLTYISVPSLLSRYHADELDKSNLETSFLSILTKLGFDTNWIGTQTLMRSFRNFDLSSIYNDVNFAIIPGGSTLFAMNDHDGKMLPYIEDILQRPAKQFLVIHTSGSHWNYNSRYPKEFAKFSPICNNIAKLDPSTCNNTALVNSYDNSILYTDFFLHKVINLLKNKNAFLIYVSDHGESLGENGYYGHGSSLIDEQTIVPLIVWTSQKFKEKNSSFAAAIAHNVGLQLNHDYIFHSILDCLNIQSEIIDQKFSFCKLIPYNHTN